MYLHDGKMKWAPSCTDDRRHICQMDSLDSSTGCSPPFYDLQKCIKYFPNAGLLNLEHGQLFCSYNGGKLPEIPNGTPFPDSDFEKGT